MFCLGQWIAAFFAYGLVLAPALTRFVASVFAIVTVSDFLHQAYMAARERAQWGGICERSCERNASCAPASTPFGPKIGGRAVRAFVRVRRGGN